MSVDVDPDASAVPSLDSPLKEFAVGPEDLVDQDQISLQERDEIRDDRDDERTVASWRSLDYARPEPHGQGVLGVLEDLSDDREDSTYKRLWRGWRDHVGDREDEPYVLLEDAHERFDWLVDDQPAHLCLKSSGWKACSELVDGTIRGRRYEYSLQVVPYDPEQDELQEEDRLPVSFQMWIQPQNEKLVGVRSGEPFNLPHGEGTRFKAQTTYAEPRDVLRRVVDVLNAALPVLDRDAPDWSELNSESLRIWKAELYHRLAKEYMEAVVQRLRGLKTIVEYGGSAENIDASSDYYQGAHVEEVVISDTWNEVGFIGDFATRDGFDLGLKVYRLAGSSPDERLEHPKLEAFLESSDGQLPHIDEWGALKSTLRQMVSSVAVRSGVSLAQLREDDFYTVETEVEDRVDTLIPCGWRRAAREANEERERRILKATYETLSLARWDILYCVAMLDGCSYDQLEELTGYSRDYIRERVAELEERNILLRLTYPRIVVFHNEELRLNAAEKLQEVEPGRDMSDVKADADDRRERRCERREERDVQEESDDVQEDVDDVDAGTGSSRSSWSRVDELEYPAAAIGRYLEKGEIEPENCRIRTDPYNWLG